MQDISSNTARSTSAAPRSCRLKKLTCGSGPAQPQAALRPRQRLLGYEVNGSALFDVSLYDRTRDPQERHVFGDKRARQDVRGQGHAALRIHRQGRGVFTCLQEPRKPVPL